MDEQRETIWGISSDDRGWFQLLTLLGGTSGSAAMTLLEILYRAQGATPNEVARNILIGIGASFVASGFIAWGLLQAKELTMAIADWIRERNRKNRDKLLQQGKQQGMQQGIQQGIQQGYEQGYEDALAGKPKRPPGDDSSNGPESNSPPNSG